MLILNIDYRNIILNYRLWEKDNDNIDNNIKKFFGRFD